MSHDFYGEFWDRKHGINFRNLENNIPKILVRAKLLKIGKNSEKAKNEHKRWIKSLNLSKECDLIKSLGISEVTGINEHLSHSHIFKIDFKLKRSYISKDDEEFYIIDNPVCKDKVFKAPLVRPSSWKGALRFSAMKNVLEKEDQEKVNARIRLFKLFGNEKKNMKDFLGEQFGDELKKEYEMKLKKVYGEEKLNLKARLVFYPTFFDQIGLDVITPHDRKTKTPVKGPIYFETVPPETTGTFYLLYFPFDLIDNKEKINVERNENLNFLIDSIIDMFTKYGFGAKTTSGYGIAEVTNIEINGKSYGNDFNKAFEGIKNEWKSN